MQSSGTALLTLIEDMLDFSKIEAGRLDIRPEPADLEVLVAEVAELLAGRAHQKGIDIAADVDPAVPARVEVDPPRLRQVLVNLAGNGVKFTDTRRRDHRGRRSRSGTATGCGSSFAVADTGPGIPPGTPSACSANSSRPNSALTRRHGGAGLGLAISRRIVEGMGGDLTVEPACRWRLGVPLCTRPRIISVEAPLLPSLAGRRVLVVMPDGAEPAVVAGGLTPAGAEARVVPRSMPRRRLPGRRRPPRFLMTRSSSTAGSPPSPRRPCSASAKRPRRPTPCVMLIAPGERGAVDLLRAAGFDGYLVRPIRRRSLLRLVSDVTAGARRIPHRSPRRGEAGYASRRAAPATVSTCSSPRTTRSARCSPAQSSSRTAIR